MYILSLLAQFSQCMTGGVKSHPFSIVTCLPLLTDGVIVRGPRNVHSFFRYNTQRLKRVIE